LKREVLAEKAWLRIDVEDRSLWVGELKRVRSNRGVEDPSEIFVSEQSGRKERWRKWRNMILQSVQCKDGLKEMEWKSWEKKRRDLKGDGLEEKEGTYAKPDIW
jgi:hypothetical protein